MKASIAPPWRAGRRAGSGRSSPHARGRGAGDAPQPHLKVMHGSATGVARLLAGADGIHLEANHLQGLEWHHHLQEAHRPTVGGSKLLAQ